MINQHNKGNFNKTVFCTIIVSFSFLGFDAHLSMGEFAIGGEHADCLRKE